MQNCFIRHNDLKKVETIIYNFIWRGRDRIRRNLLKQTRNRGGLKAPDVFKMDTYFKCKTFHKLLHLPDHPVSYLWKNRLWEEGLKHNYELKVISEKMLLKEKSKNSMSFSYVCLLSSRFVNNIYFDTLDSLINNQMQVGTEYKVRLAKTPLSSFTNAHSKTYCDNLAKKNIHTVIDLLISANGNDLKMEKMSVLRQIPLKMRDLFRGVTERYYGGNTSGGICKLCVGQKEWVRIDKLTSHNLNSLFQYENVDVKSKLDKIGIDDINIGSNNIELVFPLISKISKEVKCKDFQYKLVMNILNTRSKLYKFGHAEAETCLA